MNYKIKQYHRFIEPILYTTPYIEYGNPIQVLEQIKHSENKDIEFESSLHYQTGEIIELNESQFEIERVIKPIDDTDCIVLILEDDVVYCDDYHQKSNQMITDFKLNHMKNKNGECKIDNNLNLISKVSNFIKQYKR
ncbi:hypothetical protein ACQKNX_07995 [Lysinibacillus sp. NPDC093712]|uniref:hypothetical protein n=1 Tax=Lysinibacillus sp. NPDC093712 TaxID=3390579 RepID=UPI003CFFB9A9